MWSRAMASLTTPSTKASSSAGGMASPLARRAPAAVRGRASTLGVAVGVLGAAAFEAVVAGVAALGFAAGCGRGVNCRWNVSYGIGPLGLAAGGGGAGSTSCGAWAGGAAGWTTCAAAAVVIRARIAVRATRGEDRIVGGSAVERPRGM